MNELCNAEYLNTSSFIQISCDIHSIFLTFVSAPTYDTFVKKQWIIFLDFSLVEQKWITGQARCELCKIDRSGEHEKRPMSSGGFQEADDNDNVF